VGDDPAPGAAARRPLRVALTGGIATGKSYVRARFEELGVPTIDSDTLAREAVAPGTSGLEAVIARFGAGVLDPVGALDRRKLGAIVFADPAERKALEAIIHPEVVRASNAWFAALDPSHPFAIADIPLLYEVGRDRAFDAVVVTACDPEEQVRRVMKRDRLPEAEARQRIAAQLPIEEKVARADYVIRTDGSFAETDKQVSEVARALRIHES
jgi:dephospho-CoA kinase